jgi:hypothetical protein
MAPDIPARSRPRALLVLVAISFLPGQLLNSARGQETIEAHAERLKKLSADEKEDLRRKKNRFDELHAAEQQRLRDLHASITSDPQAQELAKTVKNYHRWLATLDSAQRIAVQDEKDPTKRIAKIKEVLQAQEERRFREFVRDFSESLQPDDKETFYKWFGDFVERHEKHIVKHMPDDVRRRYSEAKEADDSKRRRDQLMRSWSYQYRENESVTPAPTAEDIGKLLASLSEKARQPFFAPEQRQSRVIVFMRAAAFSRSVPQVSKDELMKFYASLKPDDPRRQRLESLDGGEDFLPELRRVWVMDRWSERGPGGGPPGKFRVRLREDDKDGERDKRPPPPPDSK